MITRDASTCLGTKQVSVHLVPVQDFFDSSTRSIGVALQVQSFRIRQQLPSLVYLSLLLGMCSLIYLLFSPRGHKSPPTLRDRPNQNLCLQRRCFPVPRHAKRPDVVLCAIDPLFLLPHTVLSALHPRSF